MREKTCKHVLFLAFLLPVVLMLALFVIKSIYPFGDRSFLSADLYHQYMPFFSELLRKVRAGEGLDFSFHVGIGSNFLALFVYYLASPLHVFSLLVPQDFLIEFISYLIVLKTGLCGLTAAIYLKEHFKTEDGAVLFFSLFYAFSGFMAAYNYNIMWVDCVWLLPLIVLGLERLVKEGKYGLYCVTLALSIFTNFYISIMICIFLVLYFIVLLVTNGGHRLRSMGLFALFSLLAGGMAAVLLVPEVCAILKTDFGDMAFPKKAESYFSVLDVLARHCMGVDVERGLAHWPNVYCGSIVLMLIPMYLMNRRISIREKFCRLILAGFFLLSFSTNVLDFIWHGMNYPDSLPARQSFLYVFLVLTMCYEAYHRMRETDEQQILYGYLAAVGFILFCEKFIVHEDFEPGIKLLTLVFVTVYAALFYLYRTRDKREVRLGIAITALTVAAMECAANAWGTSIANTSRSAYLGQQEDYKALYEMTQAREQSLYRVEKFTRKTKNDGTLTGYPTASVFSSTMNSYVMDLYTRLGMRHSKVYYCFDGATAFTSALLNVSYVFGEAEKDYQGSLYELVGQSGDVSLYQCAYTLPFGYMALTGYDLPAGYDHQPLTLQNLMVRKLGVETDVFRKQFAKQQGDDVCFTAVEGGNYYAVLTAAGTAKVKYIGGPREEEEFGDLKRGSIMWLGYLEKDQTVTLTNGNKEDETPKISAEVYLLDEEALRGALDVLSARHVEGVAWGDDAISGKITLEEPGRLILSVPYEDGWTIRLNGEDTEGELFGGCLVALDLEPGQYEIEMEYRAAGANAGIAVSLVSIAVFVSIVAIQRRQGRRKGQERQEGQGHQEGRERQEGQGHQVGRNRQEGWKHQKEHKRQAGREQRHQDGREHQDRQEHQDGRNRQEGREHQEGHKRQAGRVSQEGQKGQEERELQEEQGQHEGREPQTSQEQEKKEES